MDIKKRLKKSYLIRNLISLFREIYWGGHKSGAKINNLGCVKLKKYIKGKGNVINIYKDSFLNGVVIRIVGNNNTITFREGVTIGKNCSFWMEGNNISIDIGSFSSFVHTVHFCAQENNTKIIVGEDCMFSNNIIVRTSDSHPIYDLKSGKRINDPQNVLIGNHVWVAPNTKIFKGVKIGDNSIIGSNSLVTRHIPSSSLAVGTPAKVIKQDIMWTREALF